MRLGNVQRDSLPSSTYPHMQPQPEGRHRSNSGKSAIKKYTLAFLALAILLFTGWQLYKYTSSHPSSTQYNQAGTVNNTTPQFAGRQEEAVIRQHSKPASYYKRPDFEAGIVFPQWSADGYGANWQQQLPTIQDRTGAR